MSEEESCYSTDQQYFLDVCRGGDLQELKEFIESLSPESAFDWQWVSYSNDNFMHMLAGNNHHELFDYLFPILKSKISNEKLMNILNKQNSSYSTPLHYTIITQSKQMAKRLIEAGADPNIHNQQGRTPFQEAQKFQKYEIAEMLAPISKVDLESLKKQIGEVKLNDSSDSEEEEPITEIKEQPGKEEEVQEKKEEKQ